MKTLIAFATAWGSKYGGINNFNTDFLTAFGVAYHNNCQVICLVASATEEEIEEAKNAHVCLVPLPYPPKDKHLTSAQAEVAIAEIKRLNISFDPANTVWLGHDRITGGAAVAAAKEGGGRSALIHHMSYFAYEAYAENSQIANQKAQEQKVLFQQADVLLAVGPLLRDALSDRIGSFNAVHTLIPGLAEIDPRPGPKNFTAFLSGRLSDDATKIKQAHLGIAAFAKAHREALDNDMPDSLCKQPTLRLRGVDFESSQTPLADADPETELKKFAEEYATCVINLHALPYTHDRKEYNEDLSSSSVALMPSWHEGFGLTGWEAIAAGVPLIISKNSGVYQFLEEELQGAGTGCVFPIAIAGKVEAPFFNDEDLKSVVAALKDIANREEKYRQQASRLLGMLSKYTWAECAEQAATAFDWTLQKGSIPAAKPTPATTVSTAPELPPVSSDASPLYMPIKQWRAGIGIADSQLLRAEEEMVPFDPARQPELDKLDEWIDDTTYPEAVRLITGAGGLGKTRLALEACRQRLASGWHAGFLNTDIEIKDNGAIWQQLKELNQPLLIIVDYAETRQPALLAMIKTMMQAPGNKPVRLLLLARDGGEWWDNLPGKDPQCESFLNGYATSGPFRLSPLYVAEEGRSQAYLRALNVFAEALGAETTDVVPDLSANHFDRPLYVQMAALLALHGERSTTAMGLTTALLNHERRYWRGILSHFPFAKPEHHAQNLLALATLSGGFATKKDALTYWRKVNGKMLSPEAFNNLFNALVPLYPGKQGLQAVRPDILGEALVAQALLNSDTVTMLDAALANSASQAIRRSALTVIARLSGQRQDLHATLVDVLVRHFAHCCLDFLAVAVETSGALPALAEAAFIRLQPAIKSQVAGLLAPRLVEESVQLAELTCSLDEYLVEKARNKLQKNTSNIDCKLGYAKALGDYSVSLHRCGSDAHSLTCAHKALELSQELNNLNSQRFEPDYAVSLNNYANRLSEADKNEEAMIYAKEALDIYDRLAQSKPERYEPYYALSSNNYAKFLSDAGKDEEALKHAKQTLEIYDRLVQNKSERFEPDYAMSLSNYGKLLSDAEKNEEGLIHSKQALEIRQILAQNKPDRFEPEYALSLNNYGSHLSDAGQYKEALRHTKQSVDIYDRLAKSKPERFEPNYAGSLSNYASRLGGIGQYEEALIHVKQALEIYDRLAKKNEKRYIEDQFDGTCQVHFLRWLSDDAASCSDLTDLSKIPTNIAAYRLTLSQLYASFVHACLSQTEAARAESFNKVISSWNDLTRSGKNVAQEYWLCAAAWCAEFAPATVEDTDWLAKWHKYVKQRQSRIPHWMIEVARRLAFQWPQGRN